MATGSEYPQPLAVGTVLRAIDGAEYEIIGPALGEPSGFAAVQRCVARSGHPSRPMVAKVLGAGFDEGFVMRFHQEVELFRRLYEADVQGIPRYVTSGTVDEPGHGERPYFVMRYIEDPRPIGHGQTVAAKLRELVDACRIVARVHRSGLGVTHRDLKPANFLVDPNGDVFLVDFGLAGVDPQRAGTVMRTLAASRTVAVMGWTPGFAPPEQLRDSSTLDDLRKPTVDVFGMAATIHAVLFGEERLRTPFPGSLLRAYAESPTLVPQPGYEIRDFPYDAFRPADAERVRMRLQTVLSAGLRLDPGERAQDVTSLLDALEEALGCVLRPGDSLPAGVDGSWVSPPHLDVEEEEERPEDQLRSIWPEDDSQLATVPTQVNPLGLWDWQRDAVAAWEANGRRGYVEAVTASGKSLVAYEAIRRHLGESTANNAVVIVPSRPILRQWWGRGDRATPRGLARFLPDIPVGLSGAGSTDSLQDYRIVVTTDHPKTLDRLVRNSGARLGPHTLLVADECHHYSGVTWAHDQFGNERICPNPTAERVMALPCVYRLGLSATVEAFEEMKGAMGGSLVYQLSLGEALEAGIISPFRVAFLRCDFGTPAEAAEHDECNSRAGRKAKALRARLGDEAASSQGFWAAVGRLAAAGDADANSYLSNWQAARRLRAKARGKFRALEALSPAIKRSKRALVFSNLREAGRQAAEALAAHGLRVAYVDGTTQVVEGETGQPSRTTILSRLEARTHVPGRIEVVVSPQVLDEGIDVPEAAMGVVLMGARGRRQMIQRLGRVLRKKEGKVASLVVLCIRDTPEDPERAEGAAGYEDFIREVLEIVGNDGYPLLSRGRDWDIFDVRDIGHCIAWLENPDYAILGPPGAGADTDLTVLTDGISAAVQDEAEPDAWEDLMASLNVCRADFVRAAVSALIPEHIRRLDQQGALKRHGKVNYIRALAESGLEPEFALDGLLAWEVGDQLRERAIGWVQDAIGEKDRSGGSDEEEDEDKNHNICQGAAIEAYRLPDGSLTAVWLAGPDGALGSALEVFSRHGFSFIHAESREGTGQPEWWFSGREFTGRAARQAVAEFSLLGGMVEIEGMD